MISLRPALALRALPEAVGAQWLPGRLRPCPLARSDNLKYVDECAWPLCQACGVRVVWAARRLICGLLRLESFTLDLNSFVRPSFSASPPPWMVTTDPLSRAFGHAALCEQADEQAAQAEKRVAAAAQTSA